MTRFIKAGLLLIVLSLLSGCSKEGTEKQSIESYAYVADDSVYMLENDNLVFELDPSTTYFTVTDKSNGTTWHSNPVDADSDTRALGENKNQLLSTLVIEYGNSTGVKKLFNNYEYCISRELYEIEQNGDEIEVKYSVGDIIKTFIIPIAIPESRMDEFLVNMETNAQRQINEYYRKYDINSLRSSDNKEELLTKYPDLETECIYELRASTRDFMKAVLEGFFEGAGYTYEDFLVDMERYELDDNADHNSYNISIVYSLEGNDLVVSIPFEKMEWDDDYPLTRIRVLPFLGAGGLEDEGFILVPEGGGGIIEFNNGKTAQSFYYADIYGWDYALVRDAMIDESRGTFPAFGLSNNGSSFLCIIDENPSMASIEADISGRSNSYNYAGVSYKIIQGDKAKVSDKSDQSVMMYEANDYTGTLKHRYAFLNTSGYESMAVEYRNYLTDKYEVLNKKDNASVPVNITLVGGIDKVKQRFGIPMSVDIPLTTFNEADVIVKDLIGRGFSNMSLVYKGWMNGGISHDVLSKIKVTSDLGGEKGLKNFISGAKDAGIPVYLEGNVMFAFDNGIFDGYRVYKDSAKYTIREVVMLYDYSPLSFGKREWGDSYYLVRPQMLNTYSMNLLDSADSLGAAGVALRDVGWKLSSDFNVKNRITRNDSMKLQEEMLKEITHKGSGSITYGGYDYVLGYSDYILDMNLSGEKYMIIDYAVPFYQMAVHGLVDYFGTSINLASNYMEMILESAEYGAGLAFTFIKETAVTLQESYYYTYLYGSDYDKWKELATEIYQRYNHEMSHCFNQYMTGHKKISDGVFESSYEDGTRVYVNYNYEDYVYDGLLIAARDYKVIKGGNNVE